MRFLWSTLAIALWLATLFAPARAAATEPTQTQAELLFDQARSLIAEGRYEEAATKLEASQQLDPSPGTLLNLAECYVRMGRTASAWSTYRAAASLAAGLGQIDRKEYAEAQALELEAQQSTLTLLVPESALADGLELTVRGVPVARALFGTPMPTDPGTFVVQASAPGRRPWSQEVTLRGANTLELPVPKLLPAPNEPATLTHPPNEPVPAVDMGDAPDRVGSERSDSKLLIGVTIGGVGLLALGTGTYLYFDSQRTLDDANCPDSRCIVGVGDPDLHEQGRTRERVSLGMIAAGGAMLIGGGALVFFASSPADHASTDVRLVASAGPQRASVGLVGSFH